MTIENKELEAKPKKKRDWVNIFITIAGVSAVLIGLVMMFNKPIRNAGIVKKTNDHQISNISKKDIQKNEASPDATYDFDAVQPVSSEEVLQDMMEDAVQAKEQNPASFLTVAGIAIPELGMNLPIYKGVDSNSLLYGAGTMKANQKLGQGNYALASHHMFGYAGSENLLFSPLSRAKKGMAIYITDKTKVYTFTITSIEEVDPTATYVIDDEPGKTEVTLVTCNDLEATKRIIVKGELQSEIPYEQESQSVKNAFNQTYNTVLF